MSKLALPPVILTPDQKVYIEKNWNKDLRLLTQEVFNDPTMTLRNVEAKAVKEHLATLGRTEGTTAEDRRNALIAELSPDQQDYIRNTYKDSNPVEMARTLFKNPGLIMSSRECKMVSVFCRKIDPNYRRDGDLVDDIDYVPPKSIIALAGLLNRYNIGADQEGNALYSSGKFTPQQIRQLDSLISYMRQPLFKAEADKFLKRTDREVFESTFMGVCWEKPDLSPEHVIQFIQLASMTTKYNQVDRIVQKLDERLTLILEDPEGRLNMAEVEALNSARAKASENAKQISALIKALAGERSNQLKEKVEANSSMHPLVQAWKNKVDRDKIIKLAAKKRVTLKEEVERLSTMDALKAELWGLDKDDILN